MEIQQFWIHVRMFMDVYYLHWRREFADTAPGRIPSALGDLLCGTSEAARQFAAEVSAGERAATGSVMGDLTDEELLERLAGGEQKALSELYDRYSRPVYSTGMRLLGDASLAEELVQDVFLRVWRRAETFEPSKGNFSTWLYGISRNRAFDLHRRQKVRPISSGPEALEREPDASTPDLDPQARVDGWDLARSLSLLPAQHREILMMAYYRGLTQSEISSHTGLPLGTVKTRVTAALKRLRSVMPDSGREESSRG